MTHIRKYTCEWCKRDIEEEVEHAWQTKTGKRFCTRTCAMKKRYATGNLNMKGANNPMAGKTVVDQWTLKYGAEEAERLKEERRLTCSTSNSGEKNGMFGKRHADTSRKKISDAYTGKTLEERWGSETALRVKEAFRVRFSGDGNPMFGKTSSGGRSVKGRYKGHFFRSLLEYSFMKHLESEGWDLTRDVEYEKIRLRVNETMTYCPDFHVLPSRVVYEIKPYRVSLSKTNQLKFESARKILEDQGLTFKVATEKDFVKVSFADASKDPDVVFDERTFKYFKKDEK